MTTSRRVADRKVARFERNSLKKSSSKKGYPVGPIVLAFIIFVVVGSSLFQIIRTVKSRGMA
ncbi:stress-associated endoplasmic reticulum protein 2-like [Neltuma alba]|uniref:stress-associated endoplasmic reticulum protein 2-like n=1 Tax=Neltuma alba TaxID=207710 RepID=UPI0010A35C1F|nr:stress-associated endoplasmic reticulum protein 2-like [Prosopis alba]XP_028765928.1 stress-associated endoplasmic reticulum protein 2-like [Prosopis alba]